MWQGLSDTEEFVIQKTLSSLQKMVYFGFIYKSVLLEFVADIAPLLAHPVSSAPALRRSSSLPCVPLV